MNAYEFSFKKASSNQEHYHLPITRRKCKSTIRLTNSNVVTQLGIKETINQYNEESFIGGRQKTAHVNKVKRKMPWQERKKLFLN